MEIRWIIVLLMWLVISICMGFIQARENRCYSSPYQASVLWIMLTWPFWIVAAAVLAIIHLLRPPYMRRR